MKKSQVRLEDVQKFACCYQYGQRWICVYAGGHERMYWAYYIFDANGDRLDGETLPENCRDVQDGLDYCKELIDAWDSPLGYEEIRLWRDICESLEQWGGYQSPDSLLAKVGKKAKYLLGYDKRRRGLLWDLYKIQLIIWEPHKKSGFWKLKGNWEDKIWFLEQVHILDRNPALLDRPWLTKWERSQEQHQLAQKQSKFRALLGDHIPNDLVHIGYWMDWGSFSETDDLSTWRDGMINRTLKRIRENCQELKLLLKELY